MFTDLLDHKRNVSQELYRSRSYTAMFQFYASCNSAHEGERESADHGKG